MGVKCARLHRLTAYVTSRVAGLRHRACPFVQFPTGHSGGPFDLDIERVTLPARYPIDIVAKKKRIFGWFTVGFVLFCLAVYFLGPRVYFLYESRHIARQFPIVASTPQNLVVSSVGTTNGSTIDFRNYEFEVPWSDIDRTKIRIGRGLSVFPFVSGKTLVLATTKLDETVTQPGDDPIPALVRCVRAAYGPAAVRSDLAFWSAVYSTTPGEVTFFTPLRRSALLTMILTAKAIAPTTDDSAIFRVQYAAFEGFQLGDPGHHPRNAQLLLYDHDGGIEISVSHKSYPTQTAPFTQGDLNRIITTLHRTDHDVTPAQVATETAAQPRS